MGNTVKNYLKRFVVLEHNNLYVYATPKMDFKKAEFMFDENTKIERALESRKKFGFSFNRLDKKPVFFFAASEEELSGWMESIERNKIVNIKEIKGKKQIIQKSKKFKNLN